MYLVLVWIALIAVYGGMFYWLWYRKNGEKVRTKRAERSLKKSGNSLSLTSEKIEQVMSAAHIDQDTELVDAKEFLKIIHQTFKDAVWTIDTQKAVLKTKNRTKDTLLSVRGTCDLYVSDKLFYTLDFTRSNIPSNGMIEISQDITAEYSNSVGALGSIVGTLSKKLSPRTEGKFRHYEIQIAEDHYLFNNSYIRKLAGEKPVEKNEDNYEAFKGIIGQLDEEAQGYANSIVATLDKALQYAKNDSDADTKVWEFIDKYIPTITDAYYSYSLDKNEEAEKNLTHSLDILSQATENFYSKLIESEVDLSEVNQAILEHQLMREGLYSPYDEEFSD